VTYRLVMLTHGGDRNTAMLRNTLASFEEFVTPKPMHRVLIEDGPKKEKLEWRGRRYWTEEPEGFCRASARAWDIASLPGVEFVYWLEHDFLHKRNVDLEQIAEVLAYQPLISQMSLMRQPCNERELRAGGVVAADREAFVPKIVAGSKRDPQRRLAWLEHGLYWTTNPSLFRRDLTGRFDWPAVGEECEGHHSIQLRREGYSFGVWGEGEPWVEHVGERTGFGY
jgi:hypothetical protein